MISEKLQTIYTGVEDIRDAIQEADATLGHGIITTLGDDIRTLNAGVGFELTGEVRHSEEVEKQVEVVDEETGETTTQTVTETEYSYPIETILDTTLRGEEIWTDVIDNLGELTATTVLTNGNIKFTLDTGISITVDPNKTFIRFKDPVVEDIIISNWGTDGKISLAAARTITGFDKKLCDNAEIKYFNEFKYFDGVNYPINYPNNNSNGGSTNSNESLWGIFRNTSLEEIKISPNCTSLGFRAFYNCKSLKEIKFPEGFLNFGAGYLYTAGYFQNCSSLEEIYMPDSLQQIGSNCFSGCTNLKKIRWNNKVPFWVTSNVNGAGLFEKCTSLETIENFPTQFTYKNSFVSAFNGCSSLDTTILDPLFDSVTTILASCFNNTNIWNDHHGRLRFPQDVNISGTYVFNKSGDIGNILELPNTTAPYLYYNSSIGTLILGENVTTIKANAFNHNALAEIILPCTTPPTLENTNAFNYVLDTSYDTSIYVPAQSLQTYKEATNWSDTNIVNHIFAYKDPSTATFCEFPTIAPVPETYTRCSWIGTSSSQHGCINLDYAPSKYAHILMDVEFDSNSTTIIAGNSLYCKFLSTSDYCSASDAGMDLGISAIANSFRIYNSARDSKPQQYWYFNPRHTGEEFYNVRSTLKINRDFIQFHGETHQKVGLDNDWLHPIRLFGSKNSSTAGVNAGTFSKADIKLHRLTICEPNDGTTDFDDVSNYSIKRDYIPVMVNSSSRFGLYERITGELFLSASTANGYNVVGSIE